MKSTRFQCCAILTTWLLFPTALWAAVVPPNNFNFAFSNTPVDASSCGAYQGSSGDRSCGGGIDVSNGSLDGSARFSIWGQASADDNGDFYTHETSVTRVISYDIPFEVKRDVNVTLLDGHYYAVSPVLSLTFKYNFGAVAATRDEVGPGVERADVREFSVMLTGSESWIVGARGQSGISGINANYVITDTTRSQVLGPGSSVGEVSNVLEIPTSMNMWNDASAPFVDYAANSHFVQTYNGTISVRGGLYAYSKSTGTGILRGNGGEAIACFGDRSTISGFELDDLGCPVDLEFGWPPVGEGGFSVDAELTQTGISIDRIGPVPEPSSLALMFGGIGLLGVVVARRRFRA